MEFLKKTTGVSASKGKASWRPAEKLQVEVPKGYRARWVDKDTANVDRKLSEGWVFANKTSGIVSERKGGSEVDDGNELTTATEYREMVLMAMPEDLAKARADYFQELTDKQTTTLKNRLKSEAEAALDGDHEGGVHGKIVIE